MLGQVVERHNFVKSCGHSPSRPRVTEVSYTFLKLRVLTTVKLSGGISFGGINFSERH